MGKPRGKGRPQGKSRAGGQRERLLSSAAALFRFISPAPAQAADYSTKTRSFASVLRLFSPITAGHVFSSSLLSAVRPGSRTVCIWDSSSRSSSLSRFGLLPPKLQALQESSFGRQPEGFSSFPPSHASSEPAAGQTPHSSASSARLIRPMARRISSAAQAAFRQQSGRFSPSPPVSPQRWQPLSPAPSVPPQR